MKADRGALMQCSLSHPWSHVVIGIWHKYPNPHCTHVVTVDVIDRSVNPNTGIIRTERVLGCKQKAPGWIVKVSRFPSHSELSDPQLFKHFSCSVDRKMPTYARYRSSILQRKMQRSLPSTFPCLNSHLAMNGYNIARRHPIKQCSRRPQKYKPAWQCGGL